MAFVNPEERIEGLTPYIEAGMPAYKVDREALVTTLRALSADPELSFSALLDLTLVEYPDRIEGVYHLMRFDDMQEIAIASEAPLDDLWLPSVVEVFQAAEIMECEAWEFFGLDYKEHPGLRRILLPDDFVGFPLRKDYVSHTRD